MLPSRLAMMFSARLSDRRRARSSPSLFKSTWRLERVSSISTSG